MTNKPLSKADRERAARVGLQMLSARDAVRARHDHERPDLVCARMVVELWQQIHGASPDPDEPRAAETCAAMWGASGGKAGPHWPDVLREALTFIAPH